MSNDAEHTSRDPKKVPGFVEKRREPRYDVPAVYRQYITFRVKSGEAFIDAALGSFSRHGIMFESAVAFDQDARTDCLLSISESFSREVAFSISVRSCVKKDDIYIVRAVIETVADTVWFEVFTEVHDFIIAREGIVY